MSEGAEPFVTGALQVNLQCIATQSVITHSKYSELQNATAHATAHCYPPANPRYGTNAHHTSLYGIPHLLPAGAWCWWAVAAAHVGQRPAMPAAEGDTEETRTTRNTHHNSRRWSAKAKLQPA